MGTPKKLWQDASYIGHTEMVGKETYRTFE